MIDIIEDFHHDVHRIDNTWIKMSDGIQLAATLWLPEGADEHPVPAILEYLPYRKDDGRAIRDSTYHPYFAGNGYACVRVDIRGTGASEGILYDEYLKQEQDDALEVLSWIEKQPWCSGEVGIIGISWGGFNGLQIAARRPPQLKAVISVASTDDRYADDVHYRGGCVLASDMLEWASRMFVLNAMPPDPRLVGERWREMWLNRLENTPPYVEAWLSHQTRDDFWKHGSVCENYADIQCPVYMIGGWADAYTNAVPRLLEGLPGPKKGLIGPWSHAYPHASIPGPKIGFLQECLRWWDHWLKGQETGIMEEPLLQAWIQDSVPPASYYKERPGHWVVEHKWPSPGISPRSYALGEHTLSEAGADEIELVHKGSQFSGFTAGVWCPYGDLVDLPSDQRAEDGLSLTFDSPPAPEAVEILGAPEVSLELAADQPNALIVVRLCDVSPTGSSLLVSRGFLNLTHRNSHEHPEPLEPGTFCSIRVRLDAIGHRLPAGHRWRLAISSTYWPMAWPSPEPVTLKLRTGQKSYLLLPYRPAHPDDDQAPGFGPAEEAKPMPHETLRPAEHQREITHEVAQRRLIQQDVVDEGHTRLIETNLEMYGDREDIFSISEDDPLSAMNICRRNLTLKREGWIIRAETESTMSADETHFHVTNMLEAFEGEKRVFTKTWNIRIPRNLV
ncbi:MAG: CocE/NonD family hydrolase [Anaerolineales bacterium]|nr:CocE/NonD family hydrolase [Anaerolineales bacterium]